MSAPATSTRQRTNATSTLAPNTDSDGVDHSTSAPQGKKLKQQDFTSFTSKLVLAGLAVCLFYGWRLSVQSAEVGGWWNLMRGRHPEAISINDQKATSSSLSSAASSATGYAAARPTGGVPSVHNQILELANSLGVKPRELTLAIAPLLNPSIVSADDPAFDDTKDKEESTGGVVESAEHAAGTVGGVLGGVGTILETFVD